MRDRATGESRGFCFLDFHTVDVCHANQISLVSSRIRRPLDSWRWSSKPQQLSASMGLKVRIFQIIDLKLNEAICPVVISFAREPHFFDKLASQPKPKVHPLTHWLQSRL